MRAWSEVWPIVAVIDRAVVCNMVAVDDTDPTICPAVVSNAATSARRSEARARAASAASRSVAIRETSIAFRLNTSTAEAIPPISSLRLVPGTSMSSSPSDSRSMVPRSAANGRVMPAVMSQAIAPPASNPTAVSALVSQMVRDLASSALATNRAAIAVANSSIFVVEFAAA